MALLRIENLLKRYDSPDGGETRVVDVPSFSMEVGEERVLRGPSGSGKTTLLNLIAGILQADAGRIYIDEQEMTVPSESLRDRLRAKTLGYIFQTFNLLQGYTALENVEMGMIFGEGLDRVRARELLKRVGLTNRMDYYPRQLSVGQQQRVAVARALANKPKLVLADEPTGNLDAHHAQESLNLIREICRERNASLLLVSHDQNILAQFEFVQDLAEVNHAAAPSIPVGDSS